MESGEWRVESGEKIQTRLYSPLSTLLTVHLDSWRPPEYLPPSASRHLAMSRFAGLLAHRGLTCAEGGDNGVPGLDPEGFTIAWAFRVGPAEAGSILEGADDPARRVVPRMGDR